MHGSSSTAADSWGPLSGLVEAVVQIPSTQARSFVHGELSSQVARHTCPSHPKPGGHSPVGLQGVPEDAEVLEPQIPARVQICPSAHPATGVQSALQLFSRQRSPSGQGLEEEQLLPHTAPYVELQRPNVFDSGAVASVLPQAAKTHRAQARAHTGPKWRAISVAARRRRPQPRAPKLRGRGREISWRERVGAGSGLRRRDEVYNVLSE
jgi:hypothetical protein